MSNLFTVAHVAKLHEIQSARLRRSQPGIGRDVENLIRRLESGGVFPEHMDERTRQAKVLWNLGVGSMLGFITFKEYLATIPSEISKNDRPELFDRLVLVDRRLKIVKTSKLLGVLLAPYCDDILVDVYDRKYSDVEFIWCQGGWKNRDNCIRACHESFMKGVEIGMTAIEGLCLYAQDRSVVDEPDNHFIDLPGSVHAEFHSGAAFLGRPGTGRVEIYWNVGGDNAAANCGSASRRA